MLSLSCTGKRCTTIRSSKPNRGNIRCQTEQSLTQSGRYNAMASPSDTCPADGQALEFMFLSFCCFFFFIFQLVEYLKMKPDGLVTVLGEACINGKTVESTTHFHRNSLQMSDFSACGLTKKNLWLKTHFCSTFCCRAPESSTASEYYSLFCELLKSEGLGGFFFLPEIY